MGNTRTITLVGSPIEVPMLPIRYNKIAYPLCQKLMKAKVLERVLRGKGQVELTTEEMDDLIEIAFAAVQAANPRVTREEFDNWPISPPELVDAFFLIRYQTGAWIEVLPQETGEVENEPGEAKGAETLPT